ncbi:complement component 1 Q subcomponent-binding protein, mitochondrial isoform X1 [Diorhabda sublineata]|uniref:complement component 1 Q subcomponent-binding protein, mitochondrial isoform X1 n=1 Tax=Diorhabda sublineata TaxID=1163346 RepID=UPI0024E0A836|nr:complement component 1 Q subcomponent-binding protein, mitochondrial isoform X1 [Diorhabda sublineata]
MNNFFKATLRLNGLRSLLRPVKNGVVSSVNQQRQIARTLWYMSNTNQKDFTKKVEHSQLCSCGCGSKRAAHTKAEKELLEFLTEEILAERKAQKIKAIPSELDGFKASLNGAEVTLTKTVDDENIKISFNVNDSVDTDVEPEVNENMDKPDLGELKSRPSFKVELVKGKTTISLICSYLNSNEQGDGYNDIFGIDEICIYEGEWNANTYSVSGDVLDSYLYDLLMNYMEEKGISNEFVEKLSKYSTAYEHASYIGMLEGLSKFVSGK